MRKKEIEYGSWSLVWWAIQNVLDTAARKKLFWYVVANGISSLFFFGSVWPGKFFIDGIAAKDTQMVMMSIVASATLIIISRFFIVIFLWQSLRFNRESARSVDMSILKGFFSKSVGQIVREGATFNTGNIESSRAHARSVVNSIADGFASIIMDFLTAFLFIHLIAPEIAIVLWVQVVVFMAWTIHTNRWARSKLTPIEKEERAVNRYRTDRLNGAVFVIDNSCVQEELSGIENRLRDVLGQKMKILQIRMMHFNLRTLLFTLTTPVAMYMMFGGISSGRWTIGDLMPVLSWIGVISISIRSFGQIDNEVNTVAPSLTSLRTALELKPDFVVREDAPKIAESKVPSIVFKDVGFKYLPPILESERQDKSVHVLRGINLNIPPGDRIAVLGKSGSGKSTMAHLLLRHSDPTEGQIQINGSDLRSLSLDSWRNIVAHIPQESQLFDGTLRENILYGLNGRVAHRNERELEGLFDRFGVNFGDRLIDGYDTLVGRKGLQLSGGQRQRVLIARAALKRSKFMIIDEATSNQDPDTEAQLQEAIRESLGEDKSCFLIAHRLSTARVICNRFLVLRPLSECKGDVSQIEADCGSFEELYEVSPTFRRFAEIQQIKI